MRTVAAVPELRGRATECGYLGDLVAAVRRGKSRALVLSGDAGIGKSALLGHLTGVADGVAITRAAGIESEMELAYASLHQVCAPLLNHLNDIPGPQRRALATVFGLSDGAAPDRFLVSLATLSLFAAVAEERPLLCVIDDCQWLDYNSASTLAFVARRLLAERVGIVFAARTVPDTMADLPQMVVRGVSNGEARALLDSAVPFKIDEMVRDRIVAETGGNPLALLELPNGLTPTQLAGGFGLVGQHTLSGRIEESFLRRLEDLPAKTRRLLLIAAAEPIGDPLLLWNAAERLRIRPEAADSAIASGLLSIDNRVVFRHPLARSAVYQAASAEDRRTVHLALAQATNKQNDPDRRAWHRAAASAGPDEDVAAELEQSADRARARGGLAAAAAFLQRAVALSEDPTLRTERAIAAAETSLKAGAFERALDLVTTAETGTMDGYQHSRCDLLRARVAFAAGLWSDAPPLLLRAARQLEPYDEDLSRETYLTAWGAAGLGEERAAREFLPQISQAARALPSPVADENPRDLLLDGLALLTLDGHAAAHPLLTRATQTAATMSTHDVLRWGWMIVGAYAAIWDYDGWYAAAKRNVKVVREAGELAALPVHLTYLGMATAWKGEFSDTAALVAELDSVAQATGSRFPPYALLRLRAMQGREPEASATIAHAIDQFGGDGSTAARARWASAVLFNGLGRYEEAARAAAEALDGTPNHWVFGWILPELVESAMRSGNPALARKALIRLDGTTRLCRSHFAQGIQARSEALAADGPKAEELYCEAIERLTQTPLRPELARAHLLYGEWLRRENRRLTARDQLHTAFDLFADLGMEAFADRARSELESTGEKVHRRSVESFDELTAQERQVASLARDGLSNAEIGERLFLSPRTVEWHLRNVYMKLNIRSRRELAAALASSDTHDTRVVTSTDGP
ncbi:AAA family ATPase [Kribbella sp. NPDC051936]|uniref:helix-turn-helix transcriptional regulator n=1 Tax=Kribbella sp. NPDC051936 TaxID=3154946 RepID=UPI00343A4704